MKVDINLPVMILQTKEIAEYFREFLLNKAVNKPLKVSDVYGNLSYNGLNITECYGWTFQDLLKIRIHVVYEELEMDDLWRVTSLHRKETI